MIASGHSHALLSRQLRRLGLHADVAPKLDEWQALLKTVARSYEETDQERYTAERALAISSRELRDLNEELKKASASKLALERDKLQKSLATLEATLEAAADGVLIVDAARNIVRFNTSFIALWRLPADAQSKPGDYPSVFSHVLTQVAEPAAFARRIAYLYEHLDQSSTDFIHCVDGRVIERQSAPVLLGDHTPTGRVWIFRDITARWNHEKELRAAKLLAEEGSRAKCDFLANMSHELRTPLNAIIGFGAVLDRTARDTLSAKEQTYLGYINEAGQRMLCLVDDLLHLRALEEEKLELESVDVACVAREAIDVMRARAEDKCVALITDVGDVPNVVADRAAVRQVLVNLISNGIKYTARGGQVRVAMRVAGAAVSIEVSDDGIGISPEDVPHLFSYYEERGAKHAHNMKGSGIGLALTKALVTKQRGEIAARSTVGEGSTFSVLLGVAS